MASRQVFTSFHRQWCVQQTKMLCSSQFSFFFRDHPEQWVPSWDDYVSVVKSPMWLKEVLKRLKDNCYVYVHEWVSDVLTIFNNAMLYNVPNSPGYDCAAILKRQFMKECLPVPENDADAKTKKKARILKKLRGLLADAPPSITSLNWDVEKLSEAPLDKLQAGKWRVKRDAAIPEAWKAKFAECKRPE